MGLLGRATLYVRRTIVIVAELTAIALAYYLAFQLRYDFAVPYKDWLFMWNTMPLLLAVRIVTFTIWHLFSGLWRYVTVSDLLDIIKACMVSSLAFIALLLFVLGHGIGGLPRTVLILEFVLSVAFMGGMRLLVRISRDAFRKHNPDLELAHTVIIGVGDAGIQLARELMSNPLLGLKLIGYLDDDESKRHHFILGKPVLGTTQDLTKIVTRHNVQQVIITDQEATPRYITDVQKICEGLKVRCRVLPALNDMLVDKPIWTQLQELSVNDIMGREEITLGRGIVGLRNRAWEHETVLVTGAAGSIGSEICRQVAHLRPRKLVLLDQSESGLYDLQQELLRNHQSLDFSLTLADITDHHKISTVFSTYRPTVVYHAAAYKHVPILESEVLEAIRTNIMGTYALARQALAQGTSRFVFISTDKAVNPVSVMGMTKFAGEQILTSLNGSGCTFIPVRFGNVINSSGSVVPLFKRQVEVGGPVTVTHPDVTRFFMAIPEAVNLVMAAGELGKGGEVFLLDMGKPVPILKIARQVIRMAGLDPDRDIEIRFIGLRPGEKLHEELYWLGQGIMETVHPKIKYSKCTGLTANAVTAWLTRLEETIVQQDTEAAKMALQGLVSQAGATGCPELPKAAAGGN